jgi:hypothetical protein
MISDDARKVLETFSEKVSRLENSSLKRFISSEGWKASWNFEANRPGDDAQMPDVEHLEAYILNLRFFVQDNEPTSLRNMDAFYRRECKDAQLLKKFSDVREAMNDTLDRKLWFRFNDQAMTYRMLFAGMIYTQFAHAKRDRHKLFDQMVKHGSGYTLAMNEFLKCICVVHTCLVSIDRLNALAFPELGP